MGKPNAIIHIGFNKCGSTAIQKWLAQSKSELSQQGFLHKRTDPRPMTICSNPQYAVLACTLADEIAPPRPINKVMGFEGGDRAGQDKMALAFRDKIEALAAANPDKTFVISSEYLAAETMKEPAIKALVAWFSKTFQSIKYIAYIREPSAWLLSLHGQNSRQGLIVEDFNAFVDRRMMVPFTRLLKLWKEAVGKDTLNVRLFREEWLSGDGLIADFCDAIGFHTNDHGTKSAVVNASFTKDDRSLLSRLFRKPTKLQKQARPVIGPQMHDRIAQANSANLNWVRDAFFANMVDDFNRWSQAPSLIQRK